MNFKDIFTAVEKIKGIANGKGTNVSYKVIRFIYNIVGMNLDGDDMISTYLNSDHVLIFVFHENIGVPKCYTFMDENIRSDIFIVNKAIFDLDIMYVCIWDTFFRIYHNIIKGTRIGYCRNKEEDVIVKLASIVLACFSTNELVSNDKGYDERSTISESFKYKNHNILAKDISSYIGKQYRDYLFVDDKVSAIDDLLDNYRIFEILREEFIKENE